jgi:PIN domain nuclease of toxin-antitoxin system
VEGVAPVTVLDTHALVWVLEGAARLGGRAARLAERALASDTLHASAIAFWEVSLLVAHSRLKLSGSPEAFRLRVLGFGIRELPVTGDIALQAAAFSPALQDPADCIVVATAHVHRARVMTADQRLLRARLVPVIDARR